MDDTAKRRQGACGFGRGAARRRRRSRGKRAEDESDAQGATTRSNYGVRPNARAHRPARHVQRTYHAPVGGQGRQPCTRGTRRLQ